MPISTKPATCAAALICCVFQQSIFAQTNAQTNTQTSAQTNEQIKNKSPARPDPTNATAAVPALTYVSPFTGYPSFANGNESKPMTWREANDTVARVGGWRVYAREAQAADAAPSPSPAAAPASTHQHPKP